jgi:hypothetical protein
MVCRTIFVQGEWLDLEDGVQVWFKGGGTYRTGDFCLVPARTATGEVEWPRDEGRRPLLRPPGACCATTRRSRWCAPRATRWTCATFSRR